MINGKKVYAVITAGGSGARFARGKGQPKQYMKLLGKPVILHSMLVFQECREVDELIISAAKEYFDTVHSLAVKHRVTKLSHLVEGGKTRFESVKNAFSSIEDADPGDLILIHDAARPNIRVKMIQEMLSVPGEAVAGCRIAETIKRDKKGFITGTVSRENLWTVQTPQKFRYIVLQQSYKKAGRKNDFTDEAALVEHAGFRVRLAEGPRDNIKITTRGDLDMLKKIMK